MKTALVVEGGAMRGIFAAGVLDTMMGWDHHPYDFTVGVSAGATNLSTYSARVQGLSRRIITEYATRREFFSPLRFIKGGHMTDVHWLWHQCKSVLPAEALQATAQSPLYVGITNVDTGQCEFLQANEENVDQLMVASCALPLVYRDQPIINGRRYVDGGVADPIPVLQAYKLGARDITVVLSQPEGFNKPVGRGTWLLDKIYSHQPNLLAAMHRRAEQYNQSLVFLRNPPKDCVVRVIAPPERFKVKRLTMDSKKLLQGYHMGARTAETFLRRLRRAA